MHQYQAIRPFLFSPFLLLDIKTQCLISFLGEWDMMR